MSELKRCPFCGGEVELWAIAGEPYPPVYKVDMDKVTEKSDDVCFIHCPACNANFHKEIRIESFPLDTIKWWNTRMPNCRYGGHKQSSKTDFMGLNVIQIAVMRAANNALIDCDKEETVQEPTYGEWLETETSYADGVRQHCRCSVCNILSCRPLGNFCKWCGADMRGEE